MTDNESTAVETGEVEAPEMELEQKIAARAHELWIERGCPFGSPDEDWFRAEEEIRGSGAAVPASA